MILKLAGAFGMAWIGVRCNQSESWIQWLFIPILLLGIPLGWYLPGWLFRDFVPARCPKCGGRTYFRDVPGTPILRQVDIRKWEEWPMAYVCRDCGERAFETYEP